MANFDDSQQVLIALTKKEADVIFECINAVQQFTGAGFLEVHREFWLMAENLQAKILVAFKVTK
jgi:hypothetical protein